MDWKSIKECLDGIEELLTEIEDIIDEDKGDEYPEEIFDLTQAWGKADYAVIKKIEKEAK